MPDDSLPLLFNQVAARPIKRTFSDAEVTAPQAPAAPVAAPVKRTFSDAEVSAPQPAAPPQSTAAPDLHASLAATLPDIFGAPQPPQAIPAYDPNTGRTMRAGPTVEAAQIAQETATRPGPTIAAAAQLPVTEPTAGERFLAHGERGFESSLAGQARAKVQQGDIYKRQAEVLDTIIANAEAQGSDVALPLDPSMSIPVRATLPLPGGVSKTYISPQQMQPDPLTGIVSQATLDPNDEAQQTLGGPFAGRSLDELRTERDKAQAQYTALHDPWLARERQVAGRFEAMPAAHDLAGYAAAVTGELGGGMLSPENYIPAGRGATLLRTAGREALVNGVIGMLVDPVVQRSQVTSGARETYDPTQTLMAGVTSAAGGGLLPFGGAGFRRLTGVAKNWLARRRRVPVEQIDVTTMTPDEQTEFARSPDVQAFIDAHGNQLTDAQIGVLEKRLGERRAAEADTTVKAQQAEQRAAGATLEGEAAVPPEKRGGPAAREARRHDLEIEQQRRDRENVTQQAERAIDQKIDRLREQGDETAADALTANRDAEVQRLVESQLPTQRRAPLPETIVPERVGEPSLAEGVRLREKFHAPAVIEPQPTRLTPEEIAHRQRAMEATGGAGMAPEEGIAPSIETAARMAGGAERAPMTPTDIQGQREAAGAFALAERQRARAEATPGAVDVRAAGRTMGPEAQRVILDQGFPVRVIRPQGRDHVIVRRYDPRTGRDMPDAIDYVVPADRLTASSYAKEPRLAQEVQQARRGPRPPETPRTPEGPITREQTQTYRMTPPDVGEPPHVGRAPFPEQPPGPHPGRARPTFEDIMRRYQEQMRRQAEERARAQRERTQYRRSEQEQARARAEQRYEGKRSTNTPQPPDKDGRFHTDEDGYVLSTGGGPIIFPDQKQAARWILRAHQTTDQRFEIANHPKGQGFTAREFTRHTEEPPAGEAPGGPQEPPPGPQEPPQGQAPPGGPETPPEPPAGAPRALAAPEAPEPAARTAPPPEPESGPTPSKPQTQAASEPVTRERAVEEPVAQERATEQPAPEVAPEPTPEPAPAPKPRRARQPKPAPVEEPVQTDLGEKPQEAPDTQPSIEGVKGLDLNEARDRVRSLIDAYWQRETKYTDKHFDEMIGRAREQVADAEKELERTKGQGMNQHRHAVMEKARKARIDIAAYEYMKKAGYPEPPTLREGYHAVEDVDKASPRDVIEVGAQRVRAGDWIGTGNSIFRSGFDKAYDEAWAKSKMPITEAAKNAEAMRDFITRTTKAATKEFKPIFAHQPEGDKAHPVVYGKVGDKVVAMNARFYDYAVNQHGLDVKADKDGATFAFYKGGKPVGFAAGFRPETRIAENIDKIAAEFEKPLTGEAAVKYRKQPRPAPEARMTEPRVGAEPFKPSKEQKATAQRLQKEFTAPLEEARSEAQARRLAEMKARQAEAPGGDYTEIMKREQPFRDYNQQIDSAVKSAQSRYAQTVTGGSHMEPSVARGFQDAVHGITRKTDLGPSYEFGRRAGEAFAQEHPAPEGYYKSGYAPERGMIETTLRTARGRETKMSIPNTLEAIEGVIERTSGSKGLPLFYSNPFADPAVWRWLAKDIGKLGRGTAAGLTKLAKALPFVARKGNEQLRPLVSMGTVLHSIRARYPEIKALQEHVDMLTTDPGSGRYTPENFSEAVERSSNAFANRIEGIIDQAFGAHSTPEQRAVLGDLLARRRPEGRVTPEIRKAASELRHILDVRHFEAEKAGAGIGYTPGYLPRMLDTHAIGQDREGFIKQAAYLFKRMGYDDATTAAETLFQQAIFGDDVEFARPGLGFGQRHERARTFPKEADEVLRKYLLRDPLELLQRYGIASARRIEGAKRFGPGGEKMAERYRAMQAGGISTDDFVAVQRLTQAILGHGKFSAENTASGHLSSFLHMAGAMALLPHAWLSSLSEPTTAAMTRGDARDAFRALGNQARSLVGQTGKEADDFAKMIGIVSRGGMEQIMHNRFGDQFFKRWQRRMMESYFKRTGLHRLTMWQRKSMTITARAQLWSLAKDAAGGDDWSKARLRELGIDDPNQAAMHKYIEDHDGFVSVADMMDGGEQARQYGQAVARIVDQTIQNPKKYDKPEMALSARAIFALTSFNYSFYRNVQRAGLRRTGSDIMHMRLGRAGGTIAAYTATAGAAMAVAYARDMLLNPTTWSQRSSQDQGMLMASRANLFGPLDPIVNAITGLKYDRSLSDMAVGAYPGLVTNMLESVVKAYTDTAKTNTADRKMARALYSGLALPAIELGFSAIPANKVGKLGEALISTGMFGAALPELKNDIVDLFAGKKHVGRQRASHGFAEDSAGAGGGFRQDSGSSKSAGFR